MGDDAEGLQHAGEDAADSLTHDTGNGEGVQGHLADLEDRTQDLPHDQSTDEEAHIVDDRQNEAEAQADRTREQAPNLGPRLAERPQDSGRSGDQHRLERERRELLALGGVEEQPHRRPDLGDRRREVTTVELERHVGVDEFEDPSRDEGTRDHGEGLGPELPRRADLVPEAICHVTRQISRLRTTAGHHAGAGEIGGDARSTKQSGDALHQNPHDPRRVEGRLSGRARGDEVQNQTPDGDQTQKDEDRELKVDVERHAREADPDDAEEDHSALRHNRSVVRPAADVGQ